MSEYNMSDSSLKIKPNQKSTQAIQPNQQAKNIPPFQLISGHVYFEGLILKKLYRGWTRWGLKNYLHFHANAKFTPIKDLQLIDSIKPHKKRLYRVYIL